MVRRTPPTQRERILHALIEAGSRGVGTTDFLAPGVIDGLDPIVRLPSRIDELRKRGHRITTHRNRNGTARYVLTPAPVTPSATAPVVAEPVALTLPITEA